VTLTTSPLGAIYLSLANTSHDPPNTKFKVLHFKHFRDRRRVVTVGGLIQG